MIFSGDAVRRNSCEEQEVQIDSMMNVAFQEHEAGRRYASRDRDIQEVMQRGHEAPNSVMAVGMENDKQENL